MGGEGSGRDTKPPALRGVGVSMKFPAWMIERLRKAHGRDISKYIQTLILKDTKWEPPQ